MAKNENVAADALPELRAERVLNASIQDAYRAWIDPEWLARWWGPAGFTNPVCRLDPRPGGKIYVEMTDPAGTVYPMNGTYDVLEPPKRLVFRTGALNAQGEQILEGVNEVNFEDLGNGKTRMRLHVRMTFAAAEAKGHLSGMNMGWNMSLDKLVDHFSPGASAAAQGVSYPSDREMLFTRALKAPRALVWDAWMDPEKLARWWGPEGFSFTTHERAVAPGGVWRMTLHGAGRDFPNRIQYREVVPGAKLVYDHGDFDQVLFHVTVLFEDCPEGTLLSMRMAFPGQRERDETAVFAVPGHASTMGRLERVLAERAFSISRDFNASRELVFKAHTDPDHLSKWYGPAGTTVIKAEMDLRPGGVYHYGVRMPDGKELWGRQTYREVKAPERLVFIQAFSDKDGGIAPNPFSPVWPRGVLSVVTFDDLGGGKTRVTVSWLPFDADEAEAAAFDGARGNMSHGFKGTFDRLEAYLKTL